MSRALTGWIAIILWGMGYVHAAGPQSPAPPASLIPPQQQVLNRYCITCHNERLKTAGLELDKQDLGNVQAGAAVWEKVVRKLRTRAMPPAGMPRPDEATYDSLASHLETELDRVAAAKPNPGRPGVHRLNRTEYTNAVRDLLALEVDGKTLLPGDDSGYGFDNIADMLTVSPTLLERYMSAARKVTRLAIGDTAIPAADQTYEIPKLLIQESRMGEDLPFGSRGGAAIRHYFPVDGEYVVKIRLQSNQQQTILGLTEPHPLDLRLDGERIKLFTVGGLAKGMIGDTEARANAALAETLRTADSGLEVRFSAQAGTRLISVAFPSERSVLEGVHRSRLPGFASDPYDEDDPSFSEFDPAVASVTVSGPYNVQSTGETPSRKRIFVCRPAKSADEDGCATKILSTLAHRAYRRPVTGADVEGLLSLYKMGKSEGGFEAGIGMALQKILVSPEFLVRIERDPAAAAPNTVSRISDLELASRLSFFLWSTLPDDELLEVAEKGKLREPAVLEQQVRRMLRDSRSRALVENFAGQWLYLRNIVSVMPDIDTFPDFDENLRAAFQRETELFFESIVHEDRSALDLLRADYTFLNERLARHYGIPNVYGSHFRKVQLTDEARRGLLGQGSILTVTSYVTRTSPTLRGKWVLENILGAPPPPPPANVPALQDRGKDGKILSVRQQLEQHRANAVCSTCHSRMDPLGFALENFDAIGKWRTASGSDDTPIDSSGQLPDGTKINGPADLRKVLASKDSQFVTTVTEKLLTYALGRGVEYYDQPAIRHIVREAAASEYRWSSIVLGIVNSTPFQMRRSREP
jgi:mono/diheme cytochrome c family protein